MSDRRERRFRLYPSGVILDADGDPPDLPTTVEEIPDEEWRELGSIDPISGQARVDYGQAGRWRPLAEFLRPW
jgi:hypothetical protein